MRLNPFYIFLFSFLFIDPTFFLGKWKLEKDVAIITLLQSKALAASPLDDQVGIINSANLYLETHYVEFKEDTVFWTDVEPGELGVVKKIGKWYVNGDTLIVMDYEKIFMSKYLITQDGEDGFKRNYIFPNGQISMGPSIYSRIKD